MPLKKYFVRLTPDEREFLEAIVHTGTRAAYKRNHAQILLLCDQSENGPSLSDSKVAKQVGKTVRTVENVRKRLVEHGLDAALERDKREPRAPKFDGAQQARIIAVACSQPPDVVFETVAIAFLRDAVDSDRRISALPKEALFQQRRRDVVGE